MHITPPAPCGQPFFERGEGGAMTVHRRRIPERGSAPGAWVRRTAQVACLAAGLATLPAMPVRISSTIGDVTNAKGLVQRSKKPTTLTYTAGRPAPTIVLDYGRDVGGLPFFNVGAVTPGGGASSVSLRAAYSETLQFLWSYGNSTLSIAAAAGDTNIKLGS